VEKLSNNDIARRSESRAEPALASGKVLLTVASSGKISR